MACEIVTRNVDSDQNDCETLVAHIEQGRQALAVPVTGCLQVADTIFFRDIRCLGNKMGGACNGVNYWYILLTYYEASAKRLLPSKGPSRCMTAHSNKNALWRIRVRTLGWRPTSTRTPLSTASLRASGLVGALVKASPRHTLARTWAESSIAPDRDSFLNI